MRRKKYIVLAIAICGKYKGNVLVRTTPSSRMISFALFSFFALFLVSLAHGHPGSLPSIVHLVDQRSCEPIRIESCRGLGYNSTGMPNLVGHELQQDAERQFSSFLPLIQYGCSSKLKFFLCSVYTPMCTEKVNEPIGPCRSLCESVKKRCNSVLEEFGFFWPSALNCSKFPISNTQDTMCMEGPYDEDEFWPPKSELTTENIPTAKLNRHFGLCRNFKFSDHYLYINRSRRCAHECNTDILFGSADKDFATKWIAFWSIVCFSSSIFMLFTFFRSSLPDVAFLPEKILIILAGNYAMYSFAFILRLILGRDQITCQLEGQHQSPVLIQEGLDNIGCTITFVLLYFFGNSSMIWWVFLSICLFTVKVLRKSVQQIEKMSSLFHLIAWTLPAMKTAAILVARLPDGDEFAGICYVGSQNTDALMIFVIIPSAFYLVVCLSFLVMAAFWSKPRIATLVNNPVCLSNRNRAGSNFSFASHGTQATSLHLLNPYSTSAQEKLNSTVTQLTIFAFFYSVPATCVLASYIYEYINRESWYLNHSTSVPNAEIFILKYFMSLIVGVLICATRIPNVNIRFKPKIPVLVTPNGDIVRCPSRAGATVASNGILLSRPPSKVSSQAYTAQYEVACGGDYCHSTIGKRSRSKPETTV